MQTKSMWQVKMVRQIKDHKSQETKMSSLHKSENLTALKKEFVRETSHTIFEEPNELLSYTKALLCVIYYKI